MKPESNPKSQNTILLKHLFAFCLSSLRNAKIPNYHTEVEYIISDVLQIRIPEIYLEQNRPVKKTEIDEIYYIIERRKERIPLGYLLSRVEFYNVKLKIKPGVFIPRPETELVVEEALGELKKMRKNNKRTLTIADICTGSGAIAVSLAKNNNHVMIYATDISPVSIANAKLNARLNGVENIICFNTGNLFDSLFKLGLEESVDVVVANPPYIKTKEISNLQPEVAQYDPKKALDGGPDGLKYIKEILETAHIFLKPEGKIIVEIGYDQAESIISLATTTGNYRDISIGKDYSGINRIFSATRT